MSQRCRPGVWEDSNLYSAFLNQIFNPLSVILSPVMLFVSPGLVIFTVVFLCLLLSLPSEGPVGGLVYGYGEDDLNQTENLEEKVSGDEDSRESNSVSITITALCHH